MYNKRIKEEVKESTLNRTAEILNNSNFADTIKAFCNSTLAIEFNYGNTGKPRQFSVIKCDFDNDYILAYDDDFGDFGLALLLKLGEEKAECIFGFNENSGFIQVIKDLLDDTDELQYEDIIGFIYNYYDEDDDTGYLGEIEEASGVFRGIEYLTGGIYTNGSDIYIRTTLDSLLIKEEDYNDIMDTIFELLDRMDNEIDDDIED